VSTRYFIASIAFLAACSFAAAQQVTQPDLKIDSTNRTLSVSATSNITVQPEIAILHIGFDTPPEDAKSAYADGSRISSAIISAVKNAGIPDVSIESESQMLERDWDRPHKFKLTQHWTVKVPPQRAAEILDIAVTAGASDSGQIEWAVKDEKALEDEALDQAALRARQKAEALAKGMGVHLGSLIYVSNQVSSAAPREVMYDVAGMNAYRAAPQPLAVKPHTTDRTATVYAVFAIE